MGESPKDAIKKLIEGKSTQSKVGSRSVPHHLYPFEKEIFHRALRKGYLEIDQSNRINVYNAYRDLHILENKAFWVLHKKGDSAEIEKSGVLFAELPIQEAKKRIKKLSID